MMHRDSGRAISLDGYIADMRPLGIARNGAHYVHFRLFRNGHPPLFCSMFGPEAKRADAEFGEGCVVTLRGQFDRHGGQYRFRADAISFSS